MFQFIKNTVVMLVAINAAIFLGSVVSGGAFVFNPIFNVVVPVICAVGQTEVENKKAKKQTF